MLKKILLAAVVVLCCTNYAQASLTEKQKGDLEKTYAGLTGDNWEVSLNTKLFRNNYLNTLKSFCEDQTVAYKKWALEDKTVVNCAPFFEAVTKACEGGGAASASCKAYFVKIRETSNQNAANPFLFALREAYLVNKPAAAQPKAGKKEVASAPAPTKTEGASAGRRPFGLTRARSKTESNKPTKSKDGPIHIDPYAAEAKAKAKE